MRTATGPEAGQLNWQSWDVSDFAGREARFQVHDDATGGWGHLTVDHLVLGAEPAQVRSDETCVSLVVDGEVVRTATGRNSENLDWVSWDVAEFAGREASVRIVDNNRFGWGHILVDQVMFSDAAAAPRIEGYDWLDWGRDYYATVSFSGAPDGRRVMLGWMNNWDYANDIPTGTWRSAMALPRDVALVTTERGPRLVQEVVPEFAELEQTGLAYTDAARPIASGSETLPVSGEVVRIDAVIAPGNADAVGLSVLGDDESATRIGYDVASARLFVDRRDSGNTGFHAAFPSFDDAPVELDDGRLALTVYVDRSSVEVFTGDGRTTITDQVFPNAGADAIGLWADGEGAMLESLTVTPLHGAMYKEAGVDDATAAPPAAEVSATHGPEAGPDADGDYLVKVKVGKGQPTTVVRLVEDGSVIGRVYRSADSDRVVEFSITDAAPGEHRYSVELENSAGTTDGGRPRRARRRLSRRGGCGAADHRTPLRGAHGCPGAGPGHPPFVRLLHLATGVDVEARRDVGPAAQPAVAVRVVDAGRVTVDVHLHGRREGAPAHEVIVRADRVDEGLHEAAGHHVVRVRLEVARVLVVVGRERLSAGEVEVRRVAEREARAAVEGLEVAADAVADEAVDAFGAVDAVRERAAVADGEEVGLAVLEHELRPLGLVGDAVRRQDRRQELPLGELVVLRLREADVADLVGRTRGVDLVDGLGVGIALAVAEVLLGALRAIRAAWPSCPRRPCRSHRGAPGPRR